MPEFGRKTKDIHHSGKMSLSEFSGVNMDLCLPAIQMSIFLMQSNHKAFQTRTLLFLLQNLMYTTANTIITTVFNKYFYEKKHRLSLCQIDCQCVFNSREGSTRVF